LVLRLDVAEESPRKPKGSAWVRQARALSGWETLKSAKAEQASALGSSKGFGRARRSCRKTHEGHMKRI
jgi:hypothetical protein